MPNRLKIFYFIVLSILLQSQILDAQNFRLSSSNFSLDYARFGSGFIQANSGNINLCGIVGEVFNTPGSSENFNCSNGLMFFGDIFITDVVENLDQTIPDHFELHQNYPNPFNPSTKIKYSIPEESNVNLTIYNILGQSVKVIISEYQKAGNYEIVFNAVNLTSGFYIYRITAGNFISTKMMLLLK